MSNQTNRTNNEPVEPGPPSGHGGYGVQGAVDSGAGEGGDAASPAPTGTAVGPLSRRQFLVRSAGIAGASIGIVGEGNAREISDPLRLGIVGVGERGTQLLSALTRLDGVDVAAVVDPDRQARHRALEIGRAAGRGGRAALVGNSLGRALELADRGKLDGVVIATPPHLHAGQAIQALRAGLHVYLEKPMALTAADCFAVWAEARRAERSGRVFQIGLQRRYNPRYIAGLEAIQSGRAGTPRFIRAQWHTLGGPPAKKAWFYRREHSGDVLLEQGCHQLDVFNWVFGNRPEKACGFGGAHRLVDEPPGRTIMDHHGVTLAYGCGGKVSCSHVSYAIPDRRFAGVYELVICDRLGVDLYNGRAWDRKGRAVDMGSRGGNDTRAAIEAFVGHIRKGERSRACAEVGLRSTLSAILVATSIEREEVIRWEALFRDFRDFRELA